MDLTNDIKNYIDSLHMDYVNKHGVEPMFAYCTITWEDTMEETDVTIKLSRDIDDEIDDSVFFYCDGIEKLKALTEGFGEDFKVTGVIAFDTITKSDNTNQIKDFNPKQLELLKKLEHLLAELDANDVFLVHQTEMGCLSAYNVEGFTEKSVLYDTNEMPVNAIDITDSMYVLNCDVPHQYKSCDKALGWTDVIV